MQWLLVPIGAHFAANPMWHMPIAMQMIWDRIRDVRRAGENSPADELEALGKLLRGSRPPYFVRPVHGEHNLVSWLCHLNTPTTPLLSLSPDETFAITIVVASMVEIDAVSRSEYLRSGRLATLMPTLGLDIIALVDQRLATQKRRAGKRASSVPPSETLDESDLLTAWAAGTVDFTYGPS